MSECFAAPESGQDTAARLSPTYPIAQEIPPERLAEEVRQLGLLRRAPPPLRVLGYLRLGGPGFLDAALTLGAGTMTSAMLSGAIFGYRTMWLIWVSMGLGIFMMAACARFTCRGGFGLIAAQNRYHGRIVGSLLTGLVGTAAVAVVFNFAQYALATHLIESLATLSGFRFPGRVNWLVMMALTSFVTLSYGRRKGRGISLVENFMKLSIAAMLVSFGLCLVVVGVEWKELARGLFLPWLPSGIEGIDLLVASSASAIGVMDWVFFQYAGLARGWGRQHETLARFDIVAGLFLPFVLVNYLAVALFAGTLHRVGVRPETAPELARALMPLLGSTWSQALFYLGFLAVPVTTTVGMSLAGAIAIHEAFGWKPDVASWRWKMCVLLPQVGFLAAWYPRPIWLVIAVGAFLSLSNNIVGWSLYLLLNDRRVLGADRNRSYAWNIGILLQITLLNIVAIIYVFNRLGWWTR